MEADLIAANRKQQAAQGRVAARRLTRLEFEYTLQDILGIGGNLKAIYHLRTPRPSLPTLPRSRASRLCTFAATEGRGRRAR